MTHISKSIREVLEQIDARIEGGGSVGISTGYADLDQITGGFHDGQLTVVAARPAQGKSALGLNLLRNIASRGVPAAFYSLEMSNIETAARGLAIDTGVSLSTINRFRPSEDQVNRLLESAQSGLGAAPLLLNDTPGLTLSMLASSLRHAIRKHGVKIAFVDYLQLITPDRNSGRSRVEQVGALSRGLKLLAGECKIPIVCMAQLNRGVEQRAGDRPKLSDLRESGSIEQDANNVWLLHPDPEADLNSPFVKVEVILAKQRNGPTGIVELNFARAHTRFENLQQG
jgi:replicative DNA helicase